MAYITRARSSAAPTTNASGGNGNDNGNDNDYYLTLVPGGTPVLAGVGLVAVLVILQKTLELAGGATWWR
jgi:hypothetical protein